MQYVDVTKDRPGRVAEIHADDLHLMEAVIEAFVCRAATAPLL